MSQAAELGRIVRFHRKKSGLTQIELANLASLGKSTVFDIEKGKASVRLDSLLKVLSVLNIRLQAQGPLVQEFQEQQELEQQGSEQDE